MPGLSIAHRVALTAVFERASDSMVNALAAASGALRGEKAEDVRQMLGAEVVQRRRRAMVLGPLIPMFRPRRDGVQAVTFPPAVLARLWEAASSREPEILPILDEDSHQSPGVADRIGLTAAAIVRDNPELIWPADEAPETREAGLEVLAASIDLTPVLRRRIDSLDAWVKRPDDSQLTDLKLMLRDCAVIHADGAQRAMEVLFAHLDDAVLILRIIALTSGGAARETFVANTEMAVFVDRIVTATQARVARITAFRPAKRTDGVGRLIADLKWCATAMGELDVALDLTPGGRWGKPVHDARLAIDARIADILSTTRRTVMKVLPNEKVTVVGSMKRDGPKLDAPATGPDVDAARDLLRLVGALRGPAAIFGAEADRMSVVDDLTTYLSTWADEALGEVNDNDELDAAHALRLVSFAGEALQDLGARDGAKAVRRRVAAARMRQPRGKASSKAA